MDWLVWILNLDGWRFHCMCLFCLSIFGVIFTGALILAEHTHIYLSSKGARNELPINENDGPVH